jgi:NAD(P)-dependent dehydrogenase (short-subunit alcohol dehydrogenase family)
MDPKSMKVSHMNSKLAVVTGAAQGIGRQTAQELADAGYQLVLHDLREPVETLDELRTHTHECLAVTGDVTSQTDVEALARKVKHQFGRVDVLVNNAGISSIAAAEKTTPEQWRRVIEVNLTGPFLLCRALGAMMLAAGSGSIVNVASIAALAGVADRVAYNASKHGLLGLTRTLAAEWGGRGVRVNAVCPGWVKTEMDAADQGIGVYTDRDITDRVPQARFATAGDVAAAIVFLADPARSGFVNGVALPVDGGWTADAGWIDVPEDHPGIPHAHRAIHRNGPIGCSPVELPHTCRGQQRHNSWRSRSMVSSGPPHSSDAAVDDARVRSLLDDDQAEDWQQHEESDYIKKEQDNGNERAAALSGSLDLAQREVPCNNRYGPPERAKQGEHCCYYCQPVRLTWRRECPQSRVRQARIGTRRIRTPIGFVGGESGLGEKHVPCTDDLFECLGIAAGVGVAAASDLSAKRPHHLLLVSASRHTQNVVRIACASPVNVTANH